MGNRGHGNPRDKSVVLLQIISLFVIILVVSIIEITVHFKSNNYLSVQTNSPTEETTKTETPAVLPEPDPNLPILTFAVISDIHIQSRVTFLERFNNALIDLTENMQPKPDAIVLNGDLGDGTAEDYALLSRIIKDRQLNTEGNPLWLAAIGNHEFYKAYHDPLSNVWSPSAFPNGDSDAKAKERFTSFTQQEKVYFDKYIKGYHFIFLGSEKSAMSDKSIGEAAFLSPEQLAWLDVKLKENYIQGKPVFVFLHQPLFNSTGNIGYFVVQGGQLYKILKKYPEIVMFSGHLHQALGSEATVRHDVFAIYNDSSTSRPLSRDYKSGLDKSEGLYVEVFQDKVQVRGRDFINKTWVFEDMLPLSVNNKKSS